MSSYAAYVRFLRDYRVRLEQLGDRGDGKIFFDGSWAYKNREVRLESMVLYMKDKFKEYFC